MSLFDAVVVPEFLAGFYRSIENEFAHCKRGVAPRSVMKGLDAQDPQDVFKIDIEAFEHLYPEFSGETFGYIVPLPDHSKCSQDPLCLPAAQVRYPEQVLMVDREQREDMQTPIEIPADVSATSGLREIRFFTRADEIVTELRFFPPHLRTLQRQLYMATIGRQPLLAHLIRTNLFSGETLVEVRPTGNLSEIKASEVPTGNKSSFVDPNAVLCRSDLLVKVEHGSNSFRQIHQVVIGFGGKVVIQIAPPFSELKEEPEHA